MRLEKTQKYLKEHDYPYRYTEEDGMGSIDFEHRGLKYHIWEFQDGEAFGVDTNVYHTGRSEDIMGDYDTELSELILTWPDMAVPG